MSIPPTSSPLPAPTTKPFRFKTSHRDSRSRSPSPTNSSAQRPYRHHHRRHHHHHHHRTHRHTHRPRPPPTPSPELDADTAFRESLFDALADDEGALYWEGVYGQSIHTYSPYTSTPSDDNDADPENPKLERMSDEEYVRYVRGKMWEKSHGYVVEERRRREEGRKRNREREEEGRRWERGVEEALRRGGERRDKRRWKGVWERYVGGWEAEDLDRKGGGDGMKERIVWPVESGKWEDVGKEEVERFFKRAVYVGNGEEKGEMVEVLKRERVRWHPDKMQQRAGGGGIDEGTLKMITAVFQVVDSLWCEAKGKA